MKRHRLAPFHLPVGGKRMEVTNMADTQMEKLLTAQERTLQQKHEADRKEKNLRKQIAGLQRKELNPSADYQRCNRGEVHPECRVSLCPMMMLLHCCPNWSTRHTLSADWQPWWESTAAKSLHCGRDCRLESLNTKDAYTLLTAHIINKLSRAILPHYPYFFPKLLAIFWNML